MSSTIDANVLLYASDESSPVHTKARDLVSRLAEGPELLYLFWPVLIGYVRIATHSAIFPKPLSASAAMHNVERLLDLPHTRALGEQDGFWGMYKTTTDGAVVTGDLVSDAHLVALMRQHGVRLIWSHDRDLRTFDGIEVRDPFA